MPSGVVRPNTLSKQIIFRYITECIHLQGIWNKTCTPHIRSLFKKRTVFVTFIYASVDKEIFLKQGLLLKEKIVPEEQRDCPQKEGWQIYRAAYLVFFYRSA